MQGMTQYQQLMTIKSMNRAEKRKLAKKMKMSYTNLNEAYYLPFQKVEEFFLRSENGGRKSFRFEEIDKSYKINTNKGVPIHYLEALSKDLENRD